MDTGKPVCYWREKAGSAFLQSSLEQGHDFISSCVTKHAAFALQHKLNIPSSELQTYLWRVSPSWEHVQPGLAAIPPHTCPNTHLLCITAAQSHNRWARFASQGLPREDFPSGSPSCPYRKPRGQSWGACTSWGAPPWNNNSDLGNKKFMLEVSGQDVFNQIQGSASESSVPWKFNRSTEVEHREEAKPTNLNVQNEGSKSFLLS